MAFYTIRKTTNGVTVWLKRMGPATIWGPKEQALRFTELGVVRLVLRSLPKAHNAEVETEETGAPSAR